MNKFMEKARKNKQKNNNNKFIHPARAACRAQQHNRTRLREFLLCVFCIHAAALLPSCALFLSFLFFLSYSFKSTKIGVLIRNWKPLLLRAFISPACCTARGRRSAYNNKQPSKSHSIYLSFYYQTTFSRIIPFFPSLP